MTGLAVQVQNRRFESPVALVLGSGQSRSFMGQVLIHQTLRSFLEARNDTASFEG